MRYRGRYGGQMAQPARNSKPVYLYLQYANGRPNGARAAPAAPGVRNYRWKSRFASTYLMNRYVRVRLLRSLKFETFARDKLGRMMEPVIQALRKFPLIITANPRIRSSPYVCE